MDQKTYLSSMLERTGLMFDRGAIEKVRDTVFVLTGLFVIALLAGCASDEEKAQTLLEEGRTYFEQQDYDKAKIQFQNVLQLDPESIQAKKGGQGGNRLQTRLGHQPGISTGGEQPGVSVCRTVQGAEQGLGSGPPGQGTAGQLACGHGYPGVGILQTGAV